MPWVNATGLRRPRTVLEHVTRTTKFHADGTSSVRDSTSTAAEVAAVHAEAAKDSEDVPNVSVRTGWVRLTGGVARVDVAATYGQAFADTVQRITTRNEEAGKDRWLAIVVTQNVDGWDPLRAYMEHVSSTLSIVIQSRNTESTDRVSYTLTVAMARVDDTQSWMTPEDDDDDDEEYDEDDEPV